MARKKAAAAVAAVPSTSGNNDVVDSTQTSPPKREMRKRKQINYKEPTEKDKDIKEEVGSVKSSKKKKKRLTKAEMAEIATKHVIKSTIHVDDEDLENDEEDEAEEVGAQGGREEVSFEEVMEDPFPGENRRKPYITTPSEKFLGNLERALAHPLHFVARERCDTLEAPRETFTINGTSGSNYSVKIRHIPSCTCRNFTFRRTPCKHILYTMIQVLKVSCTSRLLYQSALTNSELDIIFHDAPMAPHVEVNVKSDVETVPEADLPHRKNMVGEDCPICYMEFEPEKKEEVVYCKKFCGNNVHKACMETWLRSQRGMYGKGTCPYCRQNWVGYV